MKRVWAEDVLTCPIWGSRHHMLATAASSTFGVGLTIRRILAHLGLPTEPLPIAPARATAAGVRLVTLGR